MPTPNFDIPTDQLAALCRKWSIVELSLFGSVLRDDFTPDSDIDLLVVFAPNANRDYFDWPDIQDDFSAVFGGRSIDLVERKCIVNPFMRHEILTTREVLFAA